VIVELIALYSTIPPVVHSALAASSRVTEGCERRCSGATGERWEMDDRQLIAAILTAGMLPTLEIPRSRAHGSSRPVTETEGEDIQRAVGHAVGLYRSVLEGLGVDPFAGLPGHDTPRQ
jgi:hypothetical protein